MKTDVLTLAIAIFLVGILVSSFGITDVFDTDSEPTSELQQGIE